MLNNQTINVTEILNEISNGALHKIIKPTSDEIKSGEYSPLLLSSLESYKHEKNLIDDLVALRDDNKTAVAKNLKIDNVIEGSRRIEFWGRDVSMEEFTPENADPNKTFIYFHGGSFYGGNLDDVHNMLKLIAQKSQAKVFSVDYGLAPENPFPEGILDGVAVSIYCHEQLGIKNIVLGGDSAGGNISLAVDAMLDHLGYQTSDANILLYPVVSLADDDTKAMWDLTDYPIKADQIPIRNNYRNLFRQLNKIMKKYYLKHDEDPKLGAISPLYSEMKRPKTLIMVGEYDFFRLQNEVYAQLLNDQGTNVKFIQYNGMAHAFAPKVGILPQADDAAEEMASFIHGL